MQNFVELIQNINSKVNSVVWGPPMLILMLLTGLYLTCGTRFFQIRRFCYTIKNTVARRQSCYRQPLQRERRPP